MDKEQQKAAQAREAALKGRSRRSSGSSGRARS